MRVLVSGGICHSLVNFRGPLLREMVAAGHEVMTCAGEPDPGSIAQLASAGIGYESMPVARRGLSPAGDLGYFWRLHQLIGRFEPDLVLSYTIKPVVWTTLAARRHRVPLVSAMITGVGAAAAETGASKRANAVAWTARQLYRTALPHVDVLFFQNTDDESFFRSHSLLGASRVVQIPGTGVDLEHYLQKPAPYASPLTFLMIARLVPEKGVREFVAAARSLSSRGVIARFVLVGSPESLGAIQPAEVQHWRDEGIVHCLDPVADVRPLLEACSVYVLPSYREGRPRTVLEAMAVGRAIVTSTAPGCRDTVSDEINGWKVAPRDSDALAAAMLRFVEDPSLVVEMGARSREMAETTYDVNRVNGVICTSLGLTAGSSLPSSLLSQACSKIDVG